MRQPQPSLFLKDRFPRLKSRKMAVHCSCRGCIDSGKVLRLPLHGKIELWREHGRWAPRCGCAFKGDRIGLHATTRRRFTPRPSSSYLHSVCRRDLPPRRYLRACSAHHTVWRFPSLGCSLCCSARRQRLLMVRRGRLLDTRGGSAMEGNNSFNMTSIFSKILS